MNFIQLLNKYRSEADSQAAKGKSFEKLMVNFLKTYQVYDQRFDHVWLWKNWPLHQQLSSHDTGIDLVAKTTDDEYWAIQCKCYKEDAYINKSELDKFLGLSGKTFKDEAGVKRKFSTRLWISTTNNWSSEAENELKDQDIPCIKISLTDLQTAAVNWEQIDLGHFGTQARLPQRSLFEHQKLALEKCLEHFKQHNRGKLIMACGTGKTFASLRIAEAQTQGKGLVLFLAPSIALIGQTLSGWSADALKPIYSICVCSDPEISKSKIKNPYDQDLSSVEDLALPATTSVAKIIEQLKRAENKYSNRLHVIFSTYQSIERVAEALKKSKKTVDLIVCDEAHRTTGVTLANEDESHFVKVHDNNFIKAQKRLYMTATPRIYGDKVKTKAETISAALCSMDDEDLFGQEIYHLGFGEAVERELLTDYKVLVLTVNRNKISAKTQNEAAEGKKEIDADDVTKLIGCINALSKNMDYEGGVLRVVDPGVMRKAVAFCQTIAKSKAITEVFNNVMESYGKELTTKEGEQLVEVTSQHIDGAMGAAEREKKMSWLKDEPENQNECRILTNVRCLSEGVDVPSLDAVMFLSAKNSQIEVVQSVGRVMRRAKGKKFGYIIIPVITPTYVKPEDVLRDHATFSVVWTVLNALKAHDDRFTALITKIDLNEHKPDGGGSVLIGGIAKDSDDNKLSGPTVKTNDLLGEARKHDLELYNSIYARLVTKVGDKEDLLLWAQDVAKIAEGFEERITTVVSQKGPHKAEFEKFLAGLRQTLNPSVDTTEAIEMLAQHLITKPVFEALFEGSSFVQSNPVSQSLEAMIDILEDQGLEKDKIVLNRFYKKVENTIGKIDNAEAKQKIIVNLYDNFFKIAAPKAVEKLGIVYTPVEIVDFIINSTSEVLNKEFGRAISDDEVRILDPFTGTGTFITRLIQSGLLGKSLEKKYNSEIYANEIILLAYYIASINIENAFHYAMDESTAYQPFKGICLTDTFQLYESNQADVFLEDRLKKNTERVKTQTKTPINIIIGNPPYSVGQGDANKNAKNQSYPALEKQIALTYAAKSTANNKNSLYDSYIKAFRWATDRIGKEGVVAFVSNSGWLDGNAMDGMRKCLAEEFSKIYVFNLRGNQRTSGELSRKEGGKIFGSGSRTPIAITILIKNPKHKGPAEIYHHDIGDYLTREQKLDIVKEKHDIYNPDLTWERIKPNEAGDWLNQRNESFENFIQISDKDDINKNIFFKNNFCSGIKTKKDCWCYNFSKSKINNNMTNFINFYNSEINRFKKSNNFLLPIEQFLNNDYTKISWSRGLINNLKSFKYTKFTDLNIYKSLYRPFCKQYLYLDNVIIEVLSIKNRFFSNNLSNLVISISGIGAVKEFSTLISDVIPDIQLQFNGQCFPRYYYEEDTKKQATLLAPKDTFEGYTRHDAITDYIHKESQAKYGSKVTKDDIFYYVYGLLHSEDYRTTFSADLKKMLPRLPLIDKPEDFWAFSKAGRDLADLHLNYETVKPYNKVTTTGEEKGDFTVDKIRFIKKDDKSAIQYNHAITITDIPLKAYDYVVNGRSAIEWILDRYQVKTDKDSGITNDPNDWAKEHNQPRYILDLLLRIITVSLETMKIVKSLPKLTF